MSRVVTFPPDGKRIYAKVNDVIMAWARACEVRKELRIPPQYICGTAQHETGYVLNEVDTEKSGFVSSGIFQLSSEECQQANFSNANLLNLDDSCFVLLAVSVHRLDKLAAAAKLPVAGSFPSDMWAYLSVAHNQGLGAALETITAHGLNWTAYQSRNLAAAMKKLQDAQADGDPELILEASEKLKWWDKAFAYGNDCVTGGESFPK